MALLFSKWQRNWKDYSSPVGWGVVSSTKNLRLMKVLYIMTRIFFPLFQKDLIQFINCFAFIPNHLSLTKSILYYIEYLYLPLRKIMSFLNGCNCFKHDVVCYSIFFQLTPVLTMMNTTTVISNWQLRDAHIQQFYCSAKLLVCVRPK